MPRYNVRRVYQVGDYWLSQIPRSPAWYRTWYDNAARQTRRASLGTADFEDAKQRLEDWFVVNRKRVKEAPESVTLAELFAPFYEKHASKLASAYQAQLSLRYWLDFHGEATVAAALEIDEQERFLAWLTEERGVSQNTAQRVIGVGKTALNWAWKRGMLESVPYVALPKKTKAPPRGRPLEPEEIRRLLDAAKSQHIRDFMLLMIATAARPDAVLDLTFDRCDFERRLIILNPDSREQTKKHRPTVRMPESIVPLLEARKAEGASDYVIHNHGAKVGSIKRTMSRLRIEAGLDDKVTAYSFRHTMARWLRAEGVPAWEVAAQLGHKQKAVATTEIYAPFDPAYLQNACAAIDRFLGTVCAEL